MRRDRPDDLLAADKFPRGNLALEERHREVDIVAGQCVADLDIALSIDAPNQSIEVAPLAFGDFPPCRRAVTAHLLCFLERAEPDVRLLRLGAIGADGDAFMIDVDVTLERSRALG